MPSENFQANLMRRQSSDPHRMASLFVDSNFQTIEQDLNFRETETIAMIELVEYQQNQFIAYEGSSKKDHHNGNEQASGQSNDLIGDQMKVV